MSLLELLITDEKQTRNNPTLAYYIIHHRYKNVLRFSKLISRQIFFLISSFNVLLPRVNKSLMTDYRMHYYDFCLFYQYIIFIYSKLPMYITHKSHVFVSAFHYAFIGLAVVIVVVVITVVVCCIYRKSR